MDLQDVLFNSGTKNLSGIKTRVYIAKYDDIETWPTWPDWSTADQDELAVLTGDFAMKAGKYFHQIYTTIEKGKIECDVEGGTDHGGWRNKVTIAYPQNNAEALGLAAYLTNGEFVVIVVEPATGKQRVIGNNYATGARRMEGKSSSGDALTADKGVGITFFDVANEPAPIYEGDIPLEDAS